MRRLSIVCLLATPALAWAASPDGIPRGAYYLGSLAAVCFWVWAVFLTRWSENEAQGGFFFRLGVLLLPVVFAWGTLREGFRPLARVFSFVIMIVWLSGFVASFRATHRRPAQAALDPAAFKEQMVDACLTLSKRSGASRVTRDICDCAAVEFVATHDLADLQTEAPGSYSDWLTEHVRGCLRRGGVPQETVPTGAR